MQSDRWRVRWGARLCSTIGLNGEALQAFADFIRENAGCKFQIYHPANHLLFDNFSHGLTWIDLLDVSTWVFRMFEASAQRLDRTLNRQAATALRHRGAEWRDWLRESLAQENLAYEVDDACGIHYRIDTVFASMGSELVAGLASSRYASAREHATSAIRQITAVEPDTEGALVSAFKAVEEVAKLLAKGEGLSSKLIDHGILPLAVAAFGSDTASKASTTKLMAAFKSWVDAAHFYRHAQGVEAHSPPSIELAVLLVSGAFTWLRFLVAIDAKSDNHT